MGTISNQVEDFIDLLGPNKHIVMFYEEPERARAIEFRFLRNGLFRGEHCVYILHERDEIDVMENEMADNGIDVSHFEREGLLHIVKINDLLTRPEGHMGAFQNLLNDATNKFNPIVRAVGTAVAKVTIGNDYRMDAELQLEKHFHSTFSGFHGSWLCHYYLQNIESHMEEKWMIDLLQSHHAVIFVPKSSNGVALNLEPL